MLLGEFFFGGVPKPTGNAPRGGPIEGNPNSVWVISSDLDRFKRARVLGFIRPVVPLAGLPLSTKAPKGDSEENSKGAFCFPLSCIARPWKA
jgi:hypothetical protein